MTASQARPVVAIGLDATAPDLLARWMDAGHLPHCAALRDRGCFAVVDNVRYYRTETSWLTFLTGALPAQTGEWGHVDYDPRTYGVRERDAYAFAALPPFYARLPGRRVCVFDVPLARPVDDVDGIQLMGWGTEVNQCLRVSRPPCLMDEEIARHGDHPLFESAAALNRSGDGDPQVLSYRIPSSYDVEALYELSERLCVGAQRRGAILCDLLARGPWDLFLGVFSETHTASHLLWHLSQEHPLRERLVRGSGDDPMLRAFQAVDAAIGRVAGAVSTDANLVLFSIYGIGANVLDLPSMAILPEVLLRWTFPGRAALTGASGDGSPPPAGLGHLRHWKREMWSVATDWAKTRLESPDAQEQRNDPLAWQPANWYRPLWPQMKAFALPTYSEGLIRLNVVGREPAGAIAAGDFARTRDELCDLLRTLTDARTGRPMVRDIVATRTDPFAVGNGPPADLIVLWQEESPTDVVDGAGVGRIGPLPYFRSGGHSSHGFVMASGPAFEPGSRLADLRAERLPRFLVELVEGVAPRA